MVRLVPIKVVPGGISPLGPVFWRAIDVPPRTFSTFPSAMVPSWHERQSLDGPVG